MSGSGRETLLDVQEFPRFFESGREALLDDREWSTDPPG